MEPGGGHLKKLCVLMALALSLSLGGCGLSGGRSAAEITVSQGAVSSMTLRIRRSLMPRLRQRLEKVETLRVEAFQQ